MARLRANSAMSLWLPTTAREFARAEQLLVRFHAYGPAGTTPALTARLLNARFILTPSPRMIFSSLVQYNLSGHSITSSARLRWEYRPGSELFVVYNEGRDTSASGLPTFQNRAVAIKVTRLLRF